MSVPYRPLDLIRDIVGELGLDVTYSYDDLVCVEHNAFLLQMSEKGEVVHLYFNSESDPQTRKEITSTLEVAGQKRKISILRSGTYTMTSISEEERIEVAFYQDVL